VTERRDSLQVVVTWWWSASFAVSVGEASKGSSRAKIGLKLERQERRLREPYQRLVECNRTERGRTWDSPGGDARKFRGGRKSKCLLLPLAPTSSPSFRCSPISNLGWISHQFSSRRQRSQLEKLVKSFSKPLLSARIPSYPSISLHSIPNLSTPSSNKRLNHQTLLDKRANLFSIFSATIPVEP